MQIGPRDPVDSTMNSNSPNAPSPTGKVWKHTFHLSPDLETPNSNLRTATNYDLCNQSCYKGLEENTDEHKNLDEICQFSLSTPDRRSSYKCFNNF